MIKKILFSKLSTAASSECVIIGLKLVDAEADEIRYAGVFLFVISLSILLFDWLEKAKTVEVKEAPMPVAGTRRIHKHSRKNRPRKRRLT